MIRWHPPERTDVAAPAAAASLLERAIAARPANAVLRLKLADLHLDGYDFTAAAIALEAALRLDPGLNGARPRLARCYNNLRRHADALGTLAADESAEYERAIALAGLGLEAEAEREYRAVLAADPQHRPACRKLSKLLRKAGRAEELAEICEALHARGAGHSQTLYAWGTALALTGRHEKARALLLDCTRITELALPVPAGFPDLAVFNGALAEEILTNPYRLSEFPAEDEANRGSSRVHALLAGRRPELIEALLDVLQALVDAHEPPRHGGFDPWADSRPAAARIKAWGLIQRGDDYEDWHSHPGGWLSGVYYVRVPKAVSAEAAGPGCIEFGPPPPVAAALPELIPVWRHAPREGTLLLAPSHYAHRTIPTGADEHRISLAFDVVTEMSDAVEAAD